MLTAKLLQIYYNLGNSVDFSRKYSYYLIKELNLSGKGTELNKIHIKFTALLLSVLMLCSCEGESAPVMNTGGELITTARTPVPAESIVIPPAETTTAHTEETTAVVEETTSTATEAVMTQPAAFQPDEQRFSARLHEIYEKYEIVGMSVVLFSGGEIVYTENIGYADRENEILCDDNTRYRIASISKLISTVGIMKMVENGGIALDTKLSEATGIAYDWAYADSEVELWHLLTHTAGLLDTWSFEYEPNMRYDINKLMANSYTCAEPGTVFNYCNFGSGSIGAVIERLTGEYFHDYMDKTLFSPLGMDAGYVIDLIDDKQSTANLYDHDGEILKPKEWGRNSEYYESFGLGNSYYSAQCELIITPSDLAQFGIALSGDGTAGGKTILSPQSVEAMNKSYFSAENFDMGLNIRIHDDIVEGRTIYGHPGNALGCINGLYYDPSDGTGMVFLTNHCLPSTEKNGFYSALYEAVTEAYDCILG